MKRDAKKALQLKNSEKWVLMKRDVKKALQPKKKPKRPPKQRCVQK